MRWIQIVLDHTVQGLAATRAGGAGLIIPLTTDPVGQSRRDRTVVQDGIPAPSTHGKSPVGIVGELTIPIHTDPGIRRPQQPVTVGGCRAGVLTFTIHTDPGRLARDRTLSGGRAGAKAAILCSFITG